MLIRPLCLLYESLYHFDIYICISTVKEKELHFHENELDSKFFVRKFSTKENVKTATISFYIRIICNKFNLVKTIPRPGAINLSEWVPLGLTNSYDLGSDGLDVVQARVVFSCKKLDYSLNCALGK